MAIDPKKYTRAELAKMVEDAQRSNGALEVQISGLCAQIDKKNDALSEYANEKETLKADADALRTKLADTEAAFGRANAELGAAEGALGEKNDKIVWCEAYFKKLRRDVNKMQLDKIGAIMRANYAESHPWRNLWAWVKRKAARHE